MADEPSPKSLSGLSAPNGASLTSTRTRTYPLVDRPADVPLVMKSPSKGAHSRETPQPRLPTLRSCARKSNTPPLNRGKQDVHRRIDDSPAQHRTALGGERRSTCHRDTPLARGARLALPPAAQRRQRVADLPLPRSHQRQRLAGLHARGCPCTHFRVPGNRVSSSLPPNAAPPRI